MPEEYLTWGPRNRKKCLTYFQPNTCIGLQKVFFSNILFFCIDIEIENAVQLFSASNYWCLPWMTLMEPKSAKWDLGLARFSKVTFKHYSVCTRLVLIVETIPIMYLNMSLNLTYFWGNCCHGLHNFPKVMKNNTFLYLHWTNKFYVLKE